MLFRSYIEIGLDSILEIYNLGYKSNDLGGLAFYDDTKSYISGYQYNEANNLVLDIPNDTKYIRATVMMPQVDVLTIITKTILNNSIDKLTKKITDLEVKEDTFDYCKIFHKISGIGDSLMSGELAYYDEEQGRNVYIDCYNYSWLSNLCKDIGATAKIGRAHV